MKIYIVEVMGSYISKCYFNPFNTNKISEIATSEHVSDVNIFTSKKDAKKCADWCNGKVYRLILEEE